MNTPNSSNNPAFRNVGNLVQAQQSAAPSASTLQDMYNQPAYTPPTNATTRYLTIDDVITKTATVVGVAIVSALASIWLVKSGNGPSIYALMIPALIIGLVLSMIIIFKASSNPVLILSYSVAEGVLLGAITGVFESFPKYQGIGYQALGGTLAVFVGMLVVYKTGVIRVTPKFTRMIIGAMIGIVGLLLINLVASLFGFDMGIRSGGPMSIIISLVIIVVASLSFLIDFDQIEKAIKAGVPAKTAWYYAFGLMVTLVWLYLEILRLLSYLRSN